MMALDNNTAGFKLVAMISSLACFILCMANPSYGFVKIRNGYEIHNAIDYGAKADEKTDNTNAFLDAWNHVCGSQGRAVLLIPKGTFFVGPISFQGPCLNNTFPRIKIKGTLVAPSDPDSIKSVGWVEFRSVNGLYVSGRGTLDGRGAEAWRRANANTAGRFPLTMRLIKSNNSRIGHLTLLNSKGFHMTIDRCENVSVKHVKIVAPGDSPNTDGIHVGYTNKLKIYNVTIATGDDCISIGPGSTNINITAVVCGPGHGISVGSLGKYPNEPDVVGVAVSNCSLTNTLTGVRIKTWPGSDPSAASNLVYEDIVMNNVTYPIVIDQGYCPSSSKSCSDKPPSLVKISNVIFKKISGTSFGPEGVTIACSKSAPCDNVQLEEIDLKHVADGVSNVISSLCSNNVVAGLFGALKQNPCS